MRVAGGKREARSRRSRIIWLLRPGRGGRKRMNDLPPLPGRVSLKTLSGGCARSSLATGYLHAAPPGQMPEAATKAFSEFAATPRRKTP